MINKNNYININIWRILQSLIILLTFSSENNVFNNWLILFVKYNSKKTYSLLFS